MGKIPEQPIQLIGSGPHLLPTAVSFVGLEAAQGALPIRIRLQLEGGALLLLPISQEAIPGLLKALKLSPNAQD